LIAFRFFDETEHGDCVVARCLQAFSDKRSAGVGALSGHRSELFQTNIKQPLAMIDRRFSARTDRFGIFL